MRKHYVLYRTGINFFLIVFLQMGCTSSTEKTSSKAEAHNEVQSPAIYTVEIKQMKFSPAELNVQQGDTIVFVNHDLVPHDVKEEANKAWSSSPIATDQSWVLIATETADYFCSIHPVMKGKIIVE